MTMQSIDFVRNGQKADTRSKKSRKGAVEKPLKIGHIFWIHSCLWNEKIV